MIPAMDLTLCRRLRQLFPQYMVIWCHPDIARQGLARASDNIKTWNANNPSNQVTMPSGVTDKDLGLPGIAVYRLGNPVQEAGLLNMQQLAYGFEQQRETDANTINFVSNVPVSCEYELVIVCKNELDKAIIERALWFDWVFRPLQVPFSDVNNISHLFDAPIYPMNSGQYSFEKIDDTGSTYMHLINWKFRIDGKWFKSQSVPIVKQITIDYKTVLCSGNLVPLEGEQTIIVPDTTS